MYEHKDFLKPSLKISSKNVKVGTIQASPSKKNSFRAQSSSSNPIHKLGGANVCTIPNQEIIIFGGVVEPLVWEAAQCILYATAFFNFIHFINKPVCGYQTCLLNVSDTTNAIISGNEFA